MEYRVMNTDISYPTTKPTKFFDSVWQTPPKKPTPLVHLQCEDAHLNHSYQVMIEGQQIFKHRWKGFADAMGMVVKFWDDQVFGVCVGSLKPKSSNPDAKYYKQGQIWVPRKSVPDSGHKERLVEVTAAFLDELQCYFGRSDTFLIGDSSHRNFYNMMDRPNIIHWMDCQSIYLNKEGFITFYGEEKSIREYMSKLGYPLETSNPEWSE
jgi:hypothetical protein